MNFGFDDSLQVYCNVSGDATNIVSSEDGPNVAGQSATVHINFWDPKDKK